MASTSDYVECRVYESWERYYTALLIAMTEQTTHKYSKRFLNEYFLRDKNMQKIVEQFPKEIKVRLQ